MRLARGIRLVATGSRSCSSKQGMRFVRRRSEPIDGGRGNRSFFVYHSGESQ